MLRFIAKVSNVFLEWKSKNPYGFHFKTFGKLPINSTHMPAWWAVPGGYFILRY